MSLVPPISLDSIPVALKRLPQWVVWKLEERDGRTTKTPYQARDPFALASSTRPGTWGTFEQAAETLAGFPPEVVGGLGFVFTEDDPYCGVDIDPDLDEAAQRDIIERLASYTERSPSGKGYHVLIRALPLDKGRHPPGIGIFTDGRYFTVTGDHVEDTPRTIEWQQDALVDIVEEYLPIVPPSKPGSNGVVPVDLEDAALIEKARDSRKGADFADLYEGRWEGRYPSQSEADLAFCSKLAFWTGRDPERIDRIFRTSGLMRDKWERPDYRGDTIEEAIAGCRDVYVLKRERHDKDELRDVSDDSPPPDDVALTLKISTWREFAAVDEPSDEPILGHAANDDSATCAISKGGLMISYGAGGAGKTTLEVDLLTHLAAGDEWLGLPVNGRIRCLIIENEGPRGMFRRKIEAKLDSWQGSPIDDEDLRVVTEPWATFDFRKEAYREQLRAAIDHYGLDLIAAGPVQALGMQGGGTPDEVGEFLYYLELVRSLASRPVAFMLLHHDNKSGDVSGAWGGRGDTLMHVSPNGHGSTRIFWQKVRWGQKIHQTTWQANWRAGSTFERAEEGEGGLDVSNETITTTVLECVESNPDCSAGDLEAAVLAELPGVHATRVRALRKALVSDLRIIETSRGTGKMYRVASDASEMAKTSRFQEFSESGVANDPGEPDLLSQTFPLPEGEEGLTEGGQGNKTDDIDFGGRET